MKSRKKAESGPSKANVGGSAKSTARSLPHTKQAAADDSADSMSAEDESESNSAESELDIVEGPPIPSQRPEEPKEAVRYDTIRALWYPMHAPPTTENIRDGLGKYWEVVRTIHDRWKTDSTALRKMDQSDSTALSEQKARIASQRNLIEVALLTAVEHGHKDINSLYAIIFIRISHPVHSRCPTLLSLAALCFLPAVLKRTQCLNFILGVEFQILVFLVFFQHCA